MRQSRAHLNSFQCSLSYEISLDPMTFLSVPSLLPSAPKIERLNLLSRCFAPFGASRFRNRKTSAVQRSPCVQPVTQISHTGSFSFQDANYAQSSSCPISPWEPELWLALSQLIGANDYFGLIDFQKHHRFRAPSQARAQAASHTLRIQHSSMHIRLVVPRISPLPPRILRSSSTARRSMLSQYRMGRTHKHLHL